MLNATHNLRVSNSQGHGIFVTNNGHAMLGGAQITGSLHSGIVAVNLSTISMAFSSPTSVVSNNGTDVCDIRSLITGGTNILGASTLQCSNLLPDDGQTAP